MVKKIRHPVGVNRILEKVIQELGMAGGTRIARLMANWKKIFSPPVGNVTFPRYLKGKTLIIDVEDSAWLQQLSFLDAMLMEKVNKFLKSGRVKKIIFRVGPIPEGTPVPNREEDKPLEQIDLTDTETGEIARRVARVPDPDLKSVLERIMLKDKKLKHYRQRRTSHE